MQHPKLRCGEIQLPSRYSSSPAHPDEKLVPTDNVEGCFDLVKHRILFGKLRSRKSTDGVLFNKREENVRKRDSGW